MNQLPKPPPSDKRTPRLALSPGNVAVITGASSGIGKAAAIDCAKRKMKLCICDIDKKMLQKTKIELQQIADDEDIMTVICDVRDKSAVEKMKACKREVDRAKFEAAIEVEGEEPGELEAPKLCLG